MPRGRSSRGSAVALYSTVALAVPGIGPVFAQLLVQHRRGIHLPKFDDPCVLDPLHDPRHMHVILEVAQLHVHDLHLHPLIPISHGELDGKGASKHPSSTTANIASTLRSPRDVIFEGIVLGASLNSAHQVGNVHVRVVILDHPIHRHGLGVGQHEAPHLLDKAVDILERSDLIAIACSICGFPPTLAQVVRVVRQALHGHFVGHLDHVLVFVTADRCTLSLADVADPVEEHRARHDELLNLQRLAPEVLCARHGQDVEPQVWDRPVYLRHVLDHRLGRGRGLRCPRFRLPPARLGLGVLLLLGLISHARVFVRLEQRSCPWRHLAFQRGGGPSQCMLFQCFRLVLLHLVSPFFEGCLHGGVRAHHRDQRLELGGKRKHHGNTDQEDPEATLHRARHLQTGRLCQAVPGARRPRRPPVAVHRDHRRLLRVVISGRCPQHVHLLRSIHVQGLHVGTSAKQQGCIAQA
mmetsp:Transcript_57274/g.114794  ORF Transcript_57274/g.114794 Transcript_57274/m.114794 type:complete len:466 (+) Transcript_57274:192-1589(+)